MIIKMLDDIAQYAKHFNNSIDNHCKGDVRKFFNKKLSHIVQEFDEHATFLNEYLDYKISNKEMIPRVKEMLNNIRISKLNRILKNK
jgi:hypothetical protein